jgi:hypothetical protein
MGVVLFIILTYVKRGIAGRIFIQKIQIPNKIICRMHNTYAVLYVQGTPTSAANISADEGISLVPLIL